MSKSARSLDGAPMAANLRIGWRGALAWSFMVEGVAGAASGWLARPASSFQDGLTLFLSLGIAATAVDAVLLQGWVWASGPLSPVALLARALVAGVAYIVCLVIGAGLVVTQLILLVVPGLALGALAGLGALWADKVHRRVGASVPVPATGPSHIYGGIAGIAIVGLAAVAVRKGWPELPDGQIAPSWPGVVLGSAALALGGLPHNVLIARDARRAGVAPPVGLARRALVSGLAVLAVCAVLDALLSGMV